MWHAPSDIAMFGSREHVVNSWLNARGMEHKNAWMNRSAVKPNWLGILPRRSCPGKARRARLSIRAYGFPAPNSSHLEAETLMDLSAALRQVRGS